MVVEEFPVWVEPTAEEKEYLQENFLYIIGREIERHRIEFEKQFRPDIKKVPPVQAMKQLESVVADTTLSDVQKQFLKGKLVERVKESLRGRSVFAFLFAYALSGGNLEN